MFSKIATYAPGVGFLGFALYQAVNLHDLAAAGHSLTEAVTVFGFGTVISGILAKVGALTSQV